MRLMFLEPKGRAPRNCTSAPTVLAALIDFSFCSVWISNSFMIYQLQPCHFVSIAQKDTCRKRKGYIVDVCGYCDYWVIYYILFGEQMQMASRVRQFGDLRQSRSAKKQALNSSFSSRVLATPKSEVSKASSGLSHYICINCVNNQMSSNKKCRQRQREAAERSRYANLEQSRRAFEHDLALSREKKQGEDRRKISDFNKQLIEDHEKSKLQQKQAKQQARRHEEESAIFHQKQLEQDLAKKQAARDNFRNELEQQIQQKHEEKLREEMKSRYADPLPQDTDWQKMTKQQKERYRQELESQIRESKQKRDRQRRHDATLSMQQQTYMSDLLASNNKRLKEVESQKKRQLKEDQNEYRRQYELKKQQKQRKLEQEKMQALINQQFQEKQLQQNQVLKNDRINKYKRDIEQQIQQNQRRRQQFKIASKTAYYQSIGMTRQQIQRKLCDSCEKTYPKKYMTKIKH